MDVDSGAAAAAGVSEDPQQQWLMWEGQQQQQQQQPLQQQQQQPAELLGPAGATGPELLRFGIDPLAAAKSVSVRLAGRTRPPDAFAERSAGKQGDAAAAAAGVGGVSSSRRRGKSAADAAREQATRILNASPESIFATTADGRQVQVFGSVDDLSRGRGGLRVIVFRPLVQWLAVASGGSATGDRLAGFMGLQTWFATCGTISVSHLMSQVQVTALAHRQLAQAARETETAACADAKLFRNTV
jgi:hypothetical protein